MGYNDDVYSILHIFKGHYYYYYLKLTCTVEPLNLQDAWYSCDVTDCTSSHTKHRKPRKQTSYRELARVVAGSRAV